jgi:hypothetical protein
MNINLHRELHREDGVAMVVSLMVAFVVLMLSTIVVAQSLHSLDASGYDRQRLLSVNAAESGTNHWYQYLQTTPIVGLSCATKIEDIDTGPAVATFEAAATFYAADGTTVMPCSSFSDTSYPSFALISSTGAVSGDAPRTIETLMRLTPNYGGFGAAILAVNATAFTNNFDVYGANGNDGDVYVLNGNLTITSTPNIRGNIYVPQGGASISNNSTIWGNLWARDNVTVSNPAIVKGSVLSQLGTIGGSPGGLIEGAAAAAGAITQSGGLTINGTVSAFTEVPTVPTQTFPQISYLAANWTGTGYTIIDNTIYDPEPGANDCQEAYSWIKNTWPGSAYTNVAVRIAPAAACTFTPGNNDTVSVKGNLAVISDWAFDFGNRQNWNGTAGAVKHLHFISTWQTTACTNNDKITVGNNTNFNSQVDVFFYTPCTAEMSNTNAFAGQVMATTVSISNNFKLTYKPVLVPGITGITGFKQDIAYIHEA